jgi:hypothetical protein
MALTVAEHLRKQAKECLEVAQRTSDQTVRIELLTAAAWLHDEALKIERLLTGPRGGGSSTPSGNGHRRTSRGSNGGSNIRRGLMGTLNIRRAPQSPRGFPLGQT